MTRLKKTQEHTRPGVFTMLIPASQNWSFLLWPEKAVNTYIIFFLFLFSLFFFLYYSTKVNKISQFLYPKAVKSEEFGFFSHNV